MPARSLSAAARAAAAARLRAEPCYPLADLAGLPVDLGGDRQHPTAKVLLRWAEHGRRAGDRYAHLDAAWCPERLTWVTSREALARFAAEVTASTTPDG